MKNIADQPTIPRFRRIRTGNQAFVALFHRKNGENRCFGLQIVDFGVFLAQKSQFLA
jgi:hypothetical protein